jgi:hypothetical protein
MNNVEILSTIVVAGLTIAIVAADVIIRLVILPARKDQFIAELLDHLMSPCPGEKNSPDESVATPSTSDLEECLLRHFEKSVTSHQILSMLAVHDGLTQKDLVTALNRASDQRRRPRLPLAVVRRVAVILLRAGLIEVEQGLLRITEVGRELHSIFQNRKEASLRPCT